VSPLRADYLEELRTSGSLAAAGEPARGSDGPGAMAALPMIRPAEPIPGYLEPPGIRDLDADRDDEPPLPDEQRLRAAVAVAAPTPPLDAGPDRVLHVRFSPAAGADRLIPAMEELRRLLRDRPGQTRVVIDLPAGSGGTALPMELRAGVAYDSELVADVQRRLGEGLVELALE
jgi:hypothetical protein